MAGHDRPPPVVKVMNWEAITRDSAVVKNKRTCCIEQPGYYWTFMSFQIISLRHYRGTPWEYLTSISSTANLLSRYPY
jgi:predicted protein tyrosine phosphatase